MFTGEAVGMPNERNAERIFGRNAERRNADSYCPILGGMPKQEGPEMKACSGQKSNDYNQVTTDSDHVGEHLLVGSFGA